MYDLLSWDRDGQVNSAYGPRNTGIKGASTNHKGIDLSSNNSNIPAVMSGTVITNAWNNARGWYITIKNDDGYTNTYQHFASQSPLAVGTKVTEGQTIGTQGNTGVSGGAHLHYEVKSPSGIYVNPLDYLSGKLTGDSVSSLLTDANGRPVSNAAGSGGADNVSLSGSGGGLVDMVLDLLGKVIKFVAVIAIVVLALVFFMKSFDIKIRR